MNAYNIETSKSSTAVIITLLYCYFKPMLPNPNELYLYKYACTYKNHVKQFPYDGVCLKLVCMKIV